jgi:putative membrane protein
VLWDPHGNLSFLFAAILTVFSATAQINNGQVNTQTNYDPYNPQMRRESAPPQTPSLIDMGFGTDEGNIGPFVTIPDKQFAQITAIRTMMELRLAQRAIATSDRPDVRAVAQRMNDDYTRWGSGMQRAAAYLKIQLPADLDAKHQAEVDRICALSGPEFDEAYLKEVVRLQDKALTVTQYEAQNAGITGFRHWAGVMVPELQDEVKMAKKSLSFDTIVSRK